MLLQKLLINVYPIAVSWFEKLNILMETDCPLLCKCALEEKQGLSHGLHLGPGAYLNTTLY